MPDGTEPAIQVLDTSFVLNIVIGPADTAISSHWKQWESNDDELVAPELLGYEFSNAIWQLEKQGKLTDSTAANAIARFERLPITFLPPSPDHNRALHIARRYGLGKTYDLYFIVLAERLGATLWTCDQRLYNAMFRSFSDIQVVPGAL